MKYLVQLIILLLILSFGEMAWAGISTTDISGILPHGGKMIRLPSDTDQDSWVLAWDNNFATSTAFFDTYGSDSYVVLRCNASSDMTHGGARVAAGPNLSIHMDMSTVKREEALVTMTFRGNPDPSYGGGTIFGKFQPQINSAYLGAFGHIYRQPGVSPGFMEAVTMKGICIDTTSDSSGYQNFSYGTYMINTAWTTYTWRFIPTQANYFMLGYISAIYYANSYSLISGPPFSTEVQIKEIKLQMISYY